VLARLIIDRGRIVANGTPQDLKQRSAMAGRLPCNSPMATASGRGESAAVPGVERAELSASVR